MAPTLAELVDLRLRRRELFALSAAALLGPRAARAQPEWTEARAEPTAQLHVASGHRAEVLLRWGDPVLLGAPAFAPRAVTAAAAAGQLGFNSDHLQFFPLPRGSGRSDRGLLCINHEYTDPPLMFPGCDRLRGQIGLTEAEVAVEMASHGLSVAEIARRERGWHPLPGALNRRVTASTPMTFSGPAAGHRRLRTTDDPSGTRVLGTLSNCAGGMTPWGTFLSAEENFNQYFAGPPLADGEEAQALDRYHVGQDPRFGWARWHERFDPRRHPREPNRFGWVVELDPFAPASTPVKRTALGRCFHECATVTVSARGEVVVYSGDDSAFEYLYKFVSRGRWAPGKSGAGLLDEGVLFAARLDPDGRVEWLPLVHDVGPLTAARGFASQADVLIEARRAADLVGATPLDRPEDVEVDARSGAVFVALSKNALRNEAQVSAACPRATNRAGHVLVLRTPAVAGGFDHAAREGRWEILFMGGEPGAGGEYAALGEVGPEGWLTNPDNLAIDPAGRLWIATDGQNGVGRADGLHLWAPGRGLRRLLSAPLGAEVTGPTFTPDGRTLFLSIQHPAESTSFEQPATRWPDFAPGTPPRPSVVAVTADDGGPVGG